LYHSTLGLRVIKKKETVFRVGVECCLFSTQVEAEAVEGGEIGRVEG